jgi:hypothetical protein
MKFVKLFEEFTEEGNSPVNNDQGSKTFIYYITNQSDKNFEADVRDPDGKIVFELKAQDLSNDGLMKSKDDIAGLHQLLVGKNKIKKGDTLIPANSTQNAVGGESTDFVPEVNTNINQALFKKTPDSDEDANN